MPCARNVVITPERGSARKTRITALVYCMPASVLAAPVSFVTSVMAMVLRAASATRIPCARGVLNTPGCGSARKTRTTALAQCIPASALSAPANSVASATATALCVMSVTGPTVSVYLFSRARATSSVMLSSSSLSESDTPRRGAGARRPAYSRTLGLHKACRRIASMTTLHSCVHRSWARPDDQWNLAGVRWSQHVVQLRLSAAANDDRTAQ